MSFDFAERNKKILTSRNQRIRAQQLANAKRIIQEKPTSIFITGGIGDVFALESYFPDVIKNNITTVYYATRKSDTIIEFFNSLNYPHLKNHIVVWPEFKDFWCFYSKDECIIRMKSSGIKYPEELNYCDDWSIAVKFPRINSGYIKYNKSTPMENRLCSVSDFGLPKKYFVICPYSSDKRIGGRDFSEDDWKNTFKILDRAEVTGVLLNNGMDIPPVMDNIIDLTNQTSLAESIEILKNSEGYVGINSCLSVLAAKKFTNNLYIKNQDDHCFRNKHIYYAPKESFEFLRSFISVKD